MASLNELYESSPELTLNHLRIAIREARENPDSEEGLAWEKLAMIPAILNMTLQLMPKSLEDLVELTPSSLSLHPVHKNALAVNHGGSTHILLGSKDLDCCPLLALAIFMETRDVFPRGSESLLFAVDDFKNSKQIKDFVTKFVDDALGGAFDIWFQNLDGYLRLVAKKAGVKEKKLDARRPWNAKKAKKAFDSKRDVEVATALAVHGPTEYITAENYVEELDEKWLALKVVPNICCSGVDRGVAALLGRTILYAALHQDTGHILDTRIREEIIEECATKKALGSIVELNDFKLKKSKRERKKGDSPSKSSATPKKRSAPEDPQESEDGPSAKKRKKTTSSSKKGKISKDNAGIPESPIADKGKTSEGVKTAPRKATAASKKATADKGKTSEGGKTVPKKPTAASKKATDDKGKTSEGGKTVVKKATAASKKATDDKGKTSEGVKTVPKKPTVALKKATVDKGKTSEGGKTVVKKATAASKKATDDKGKTSEGVTTVLKKATAASKKATDDKGKTSEGGKTVPKKATAASKKVLLSENTQGDEETPLPKKKPSQSKKKDIPPSDSSPAKENDKDAAVGTKSKGTKTVLKRATAASKKTSSSDSPAEDQGKSATASGGTTTSEGAKAAPKKTSAASRKESSSGLAKKTNVPAVAKTSKKDASPSELPNKEVGTATVKNTKNTKSTEGTSKSKKRKAPPPADDGPSANGTSISAQKKAKRTSAADRMTPGEREGTISVASLDESVMAIRNELVDNIDNIVKLFGSLTQLVSSVGSNEHGSNDVKSRPKKNQNTSSNTKKASVARKPPAKLSGRPRTLQRLWEEYTNGLGGNKPADSFTDDEKRSEEVRGLYTRRCGYWEAMEKVLAIRSKQMTAELALSEIEKCYFPEGDGLSLSKKLDLINADQHKKFAKLKEAINVIESEGLDESGLKDDA